MKLKCVATYCILMKQNALAEMEGWRRIIAYQHHTQLSFPFLFKEPKLSAASELDIYKPES